MRFMYAKHPEIARRWSDEYGVPKNLLARKAAPKMKGRKK